MSGLPATLRAARPRPHWEDEACRRVDLERALDRLPAHLVVVLWLRVLGWTMTEIAEAHEVSRARVWQWVQTIRARLALLREAA